MAKFPSWGFELSELITAVPDHPAVEFASFAIEAALDWVCKSWPIAPSKNIKENDNNNSSTFFI